MNRRLCAALLSLSILLCAACGTKQTESGGLALYYLTDAAGSAGGDAVGKETYAAALPEEPQQAAEQLLQRYFQGPEDPALTSPLPESLQLQGVTLNGTHAYVDVSASYGTLSGIDLTLADSCITLTLTQLPAVSTVTITVNGKALEYRDIQNLHARDVLVGNTEDLIATVTATLYFLDASGALVPEEREIDVYEGETRVEDVLAALLSGPEGAELRPVFPAEYNVLSVWTEEEICCVNLSSESLRLFSGGGESVALLAAADSLLSLEGVSSVQFLVDGAVAEYYGAAKVGTPYTAPGK